MVSYVHVGQGEGGSLYAFTSGYDHASPALFPASTQSPTLTPPTPAPITSSFPSQCSVSASRSSCILSRCPGINVGIQFSFRRTFQYTGSGRDRCRCSSRCRLTNGRDVCSSVKAGYGPPIMTVSLVSGAGVSWAEREHESNTVPRILGELLE